MKRWTIFPYLAREVIQHKLEWEKLPPKMEIPHLKTVMAVWKPSVRAVKQSWRHKGREGRQEQSQHSFEVENASQQFATQRVESTPTTWFTRISPEKRKYKHKIMCFWSVIYLAFSLWIWSRVCSLWGAVSERSCYLKFRANWKRLKKIQRKEIWVLLMSCKNVFRH